MQIFIGRGQAEAEGDTRCLETVPESPLLHDRCRSGFLGLMIGGYLVTDKLNRGRV